MSKPASRDFAGSPHSETITACGNSSSRKARTCCQTAIVPSESGSAFTSEPAMSTRKPSHPALSQKRMTSSIAAMVACGPGASVGCCHDSVT